MSEFWNGLIANFSEFFSWDAILSTLSNPESWAIIGSLIILEGLLSADNALVLAVMVKHLPPEQRKRALFYGILGAYVFRFIAIGLGVYLVQIWWIKLAGALYLLHIALDGLGVYSAIGKWFKKTKDKDDDGNEVVNKGGSFWKTVLMVELMDIAFSIDSVIAAFGISEQIWVLFLGGILGVLMMRFVAGIFLKLIDWAPALEKIAYVIVSLIGLKMIVALVGFNIPHYAFFIIIITLFAGPIVSKYIEEKQAKKA